ncbi:ABC transporter ATP-binding protein [bacterium]|nr:ABC transporter ATP-binding protein [bacterium]
METSDSFALRIKDVYKTFDTEARVVEVLKGVSITVNANEAVAVTGPSGSGKSTLLHLIGTLDSPTSGTIEIGGRDPFALSETELAEFRNRVVGFVFQDHHLLPQYSVLENVLIPTLAFKANGSGSLSRAKELLDRVGLSNRVDHRPAELSGGERQRVAIARALINQPKIVLCDEPTGNLDRKTAGVVADLFFKLHEDEKNVLIVVTHSVELAQRFSRKLELREGTCVEV